MTIGGYIAIIRLVAKFSRAYSKAVKAERVKDGDVSVLDYITCAFDALGSITEDELIPVIEIAKKAGSK